MGELYRFNTGRLYSKEGQRIAWVHTEYLYCRYNWDGEPGMWSKNYDFPRVQL